MAAVDALDKKQPKSALVPTVRGGIYLAKRELVNARKSFEAALQIDPEYYSAAYSLAVLDIREGRPQAARERFDKILAKNPKNEQVVLANVELLRLMGGTDEQVKAALDKAVEANPASVRTRLARINEDLRRRDGNAAVASARVALAAIPNDPQLLDALGAAQIVSGDVNQGVDTFKKITQLQPQNPLALMRLADAQVATKDYNAALDTERKALALKPDYTQISARLAKIYVLAGRPGDAIAEARKVQKSQPDKAVGYALEGEVLVAQGKWAEAAAAFQTGFAKQPVPGLAVGAYIALQRAGKSADASAMAGKWMKQYPKDASIPLVLAEESQRRGNLAEAKSGYRKVLDIEPENATALNNLAWILTEDGDAKGLEYAEAAHRLAPFNPGVLDTLGVAVLKSGDAKRGATLLRMASVLAPKQPDIRLHLAKALAASGDKAGARKELENLGSLDQASPIRAEADKLKGSL
jgi:putative PEP-CTERM system TPR-repeat lipoprotein